MIKYGSTFRIPILFITLFLFSLFPSDKKACFSTYTLISPRPHFDSPPHPYSLSLSHPSFFLCSLPNYLFPKFRIPGKGHGSVLIRSPAPLKFKIWNDQAVQRYVPHKYSYYESLVNEWEKVIVQQNNALSSVGVGRKCRRGGGWDAESLEQQFALLHFTGGGNRRRSRLDKYSLCILPIS